MHRQSLLLVAPRQLEWVDELLPALREEEILVKTTLGAISIGAELPQYRGDDQADSGRLYPRMTGYESLGVVIDRGAKVQHIQVGQRVVGFWGHRTHALVDSRKAIPVPESVDDALALLTILSCDAAKGVLKADPKPESATLITGAGTMGLLALHFLKRRLGLQRVVVAEPNDERRELAKLVGADAVVVSHDVGAECYDLGLECSGRNTAFALLQNAVRHNGRIIVLSDGNVERLVLSSDFTVKS